MANGSISTHSSSEGSSDDTFSLEAATQIVHDGLELLEPVERIHYNLDRGALHVESANGNFDVLVRLPEVESLRDKHGGFWGAHPQYPVSDWRTEVENDTTRLGYWEWVESLLDTEELTPSN